MSPGLSPQTVGHHGGTYTWARVGLTTFCLESSSQQLYRGTGVTKEKTETEEGVPSLNSRSNKCISGLEPGSLQADSEFFTPHPSSGPKNWGGLSRSQHSGSMTSSVVSVWGAGGAL